MKSFLKPLLVLGVLATGISAVALNVPSAHATNTACVDGSKRANLSVTWNSASSVSVHTVGNKPLCADTTLYFSSYTMPDNYNGLPFAGNPTATPQTIFDSKPVTLKKGTTGNSTLTIKLPEACKNIQVDLYYAPEIKNVGPAGHGTQYITGKIIKKTKDSCTPVTPEEPEKPTPTPEVPKEEAQTPPTPAPAVEAPQTPTTLPSTGLGDAFTVAALISAGAYATVYAIKKRQ